MGLLSNRIEKENLKAGDHIYSWRTAYIYAHHGIYVGDYNIIHFTRGRGEELGTGTVLDRIPVSSLPNQSQIPCLICASQQETAHGVVSSCLDCFLAGGILNRFEYSVSPALFLFKARGGTCTLADSDPDEIVVHRANYLLNNGFGCYNVFNNNCEDFAIYCKTGLLVVDEGRVGRSGQAVSIIHGTLSAVLSSPLRLVTTNVYGMAATAIGVYCASRYGADIGNRRDVVKVEVEDLSARHATDVLQVAPEVKVEDLTTRLAILQMAPEVKVEDLTTRLGTGILHVAPENPVVSFQGSRSSGVVKWFNTDRGFGFITPGDGGEDLFVHQSSIKSNGYHSLAEGEHVEFEIEEGEDGRTKAVDVTGPNGSFVQGDHRGSGGGGRGGRGGGYEFGGGYGGRGRRGGRNGGGKRYGRGTCYNCGECGHLARDCSYGGSGGGRFGSNSSGRGGGGGERYGGGLGACYNCGERSHLARDCSYGGSGGGRFGSSSSGGGGGERYGGERYGGGRGACYNCEERGHLARDCSYGGSGGGRFGSSGGGGGGGERYCGGRGACYNCGECSHLARDCNYGGSGGGRFGGSSGSGGGGSWG